MCKDFSIREIQDPTTLQRKNKNKINHIENENVPLKTKM